MTHHQSARALSFIAIAGLVACGVLTNAPDGQTVPVTPNQEFQLGPGQTAAITDGDLSVRFDSVSNDSRCPMGVFCIQAGDASVYLTISRGKRMPSAALVHVLNEPRSVVDGSETIELVALLPLRRREEQIKPTDYQVQLVIRTK